jgi:DNA invertase Pin-like site-specific DNA recombinase
MTDTKVAIYGRISTKDQNIESQLLVDRDFCARNGFEITAEFKDEGESGAKSSRPQLNLMMDGYVRTGRVNTVVIFKLDRLGRSLSHLLDLLAEFKNRKIRLISVSDNLDTFNDNPMSRAFWQLLGVFAEFERAIITERIHSGLSRAKAEGKRLGRPRGSKDKMQRSRSGYHRRYAGKSAKERKLGPRRKEENQNA